MQKNCEQCGKLFSPKHSTQRFCSVPCSGKWTAEHRRSFSGENNPNFGKHHTDEARERIRAARLGTTASAETREKLSAAHSGKPKPAWWRKKISEALIGNSKVNHSGERNQNYKTGKYVNERAYRKLVDISTCVECGKSGVILEVHHKNGNHDDNRISNLAVLCKRCHGKKHGRPKAKGQSRDKHPVLR